MMPTWKNCEKKKLSDVAMTACSLLFVIRSRRLTMAFQSSRDRYGYRSTCKIRNGSKQVKWNYRQVNDTYMHICSYMRLPGMHLDLKCMSAD